MKCSSKWYQQFCKTSSNPKNSAKSLFSPKKQLKSKHTGKSISTLRNVSKIQNSETWLELTKQLGADSKITVGRIPVFWIHVSYATDILVTVVNWIKHSSRPLGIFSNPNLPAKDNLLSPSSSPLLACCGSAHFQIFSVLFVFWPHQASWIMHQVCYTILVRSFVRLCFLSFMIYTLTCK